MIGANTTTGTRSENEGVVAALVLAKWLHFAAAPTFTVMALLTVVLDGSPSDAFCSAAGGLGAGGMAPMYLLMAAFHLGPWLKLISRRRSVVRHDSFPGSRSF